jgi:hypothetical protein
MADRKLLSAASGTMRPLLLMRPWQGTAPQIGVLATLEPSRALGLQTENPICHD